MVKDQYHVEDFDTVRTLNADNRGRVNLGSEFADSQVFVLASRLPENPGGTRPSQDEERVLSQLTQWAVEHNFSIQDYDVENGRILHDGAEWIDTDVEGLVGNE